jgi:zinc protease
MNTKQLTCGIALTFSLALCAQIALAQSTEPSGPAGQTLKGAVLKNKAPINNRTLRINLPKPVEFQLSNGARVVLIEDHKTPTLYVQCVLLERGDAFDAKDLQGVARLTAAQLREGTTTRSAQQLSEQLDTIGGSLGGATSAMDSSVSVSGLSEHADTLFGLLSDVLIHPTFPEAELERYKARLVSQLQSQRSSPGFLAREQFNKAMYGDHPASIIAPAEEHIKKITVADLKSYHERYYRPNAALLFVAGDINAKQLQPKLEQAFRDWKPNTEKRAALPIVTGPAKSQVVVVDRPGSVQTSLLMGTLGIKGDDADRYALGVMNQVLGSGAASRLFMNLREDKGYTYGAYSGVSWNRFPGVVSANAEVRTEVTEGAMKEFILELKRIATEPVGAVELANAKRAIVGRFALALEEPRTFTNYVFEQKIYGFPADYWDHYAERVDAITAADVQRVAAKYIDLKRIQIVAVGDGSKIRDVMKGYENLSTP